MPEQNGPYWIPLYNDFIAETEPSRLRERLGTLEQAIACRFQELGGEGSNERIALQRATDKLLQIKTTKLGFRQSEG